MREDEATLKPTALITVLIFRFETGNVRKV